MMSKHVLIYRPSFMFILFWLLNVEDMTVQICHLLNNGFVWCIYSSRDALSLTTDLAVSSGHVFSVSLDQPLI